MLTLAALLGACSSPAPINQDSLLKQFNPPPNDEASLYIYRNQPLDAGVKMTLHLNGERLGKTLGQTYLHQRLKPGTYQLTAIASNTATLTLNLQPGTHTFVWQQVHLALPSATTELHLVGPEQGQAGVMESTLAKQCTLFGRLCPDWAEFD